MLLGVVDVLLGDVYEVIGVVEVLFGSVEELSGVVEAFPDVAEV